MTPEQTTVVHNEPHGQTYCPVLKRDVPADEVVAFQFIPLDEAPAFVSYALSMSQNGTPGALSIGQLKHNKLRVHESVAKALNDGDLVMMGSQRGQMAWWKKFHLRTYLVNPKLTDDLIDKGQGATWKELHNQEVDIRSEGQPSLDRVFYRYVLTVRIRFNAFVAADRNLDHFFSVFPRWDLKASAVLMYCTAAKNILDGCPTKNEATFKRLFSLVRPCLSWSSRSATRVYENESAYFLPQTDPPSLAASVRPPHTKQIEQMQPITKYVAARARSNFRTWYRDKRRGYKQVIPSPKPGKHRVPAKVDFNVPEVLPDVDSVLKVSPEITGTSDPNQQSPNPKGNSRVSDQPNQTTGNIRPSEGTSKNGSDKRSEPNLGHVSCAPENLSAHNDREDDSEPEDPTTGQYTKPSKYFNGRPPPPSSKLRAKGQPSKSQHATRSCDKQEDAKDIRQNSNAFIKDVVDNRLIGNALPTRGLIRIVFKPFSSNENGVLVSPLSETSSNSRVQDSSLGSLPSIQPLLPLIPEDEAMSGWISASVYKTSTSSHISATLRRRSLQDLGRHSIHSKSESSAHTQPSTDRDDSPGRGRTLVKGTRRSSSTDLSASFIEIAKRNLRLQANLHVKEQISRVVSWQLSVQTPSPHLSEDQGELQTLEASTEEETTDAGVAEAIQRVSVDSHFGLAHNDLSVEIFPAMPSSSHESNSRPPKTGSTDVGVGRELGSMKVTSPCRSCIGNHLENGAIRAEPQFDARNVRRRVFVGEFDDDSEAHTPIATTFESYQTSYDRYKSQILSLSKGGMEDAPAADHGSLLIDSRPPSIIDIWDLEKAQDIVKVLGIAQDSPNDSVLRDVLALAIARVLSAHGVLKIDGYKLWSLASKPDQYWRLREAFKQMKLDQDLVRRQLYVYLHMGAYGMNPMTKIIRPECHDTAVVDRKQWNQRLRDHEKQRRSLVVDLEAYGDVTTITCNAVLDITGSDWDFRSQDSVPPKFDNEQSSNSRRPSSMPPLGRALNTLHFADFLRAPPIVDPFYLGREIGSGEDDLSTFRPGQTGNTEDADFASSGGLNPLESDLRPLSITSSPVPSSNDNHAGPSEPRKLLAFATSPQPLINDAPSASEPSPSFSPEALLPFHDPLLPTPPSQIRRNVLSEDDLTLLGTPSPLRLSQELERVSQEGHRESWYPGDDGVIEQTASSQGAGHLPITRKKSRSERAAEDRRRGKRVPEREGSADPFVDERKENILHGKPKYVGKGKGKAVLEGDEEGLREGEGREAPLAEDGQEDFKEKMERVASRSSRGLSQPTKRETIEQNKELHNLELDSQSDEAEVPGIFECKRTKSQSSETEQRAEDSKEEDKQEPQVENGKSRLMRKRTKGWASWWPPGS